MKYDFVIAGAGYAGAVSARKLADAGKKVLLLEQQPHVGGHSHDMVDAHGFLIHPCGPHIFHTNNKTVFEFLSRFTLWRFYEHRVLAQVNGRLYPMPINRTTINQLYGLSLSEDDVAAYYEKVRQPRDPIETSEDVVLNSVGPDLCDKFFRNYTLKQWGLELGELSAGVAARIPVRTNDDDRYFTDTYQFMPSDGYTAMFRRMLDHPLIEVQLSTPYTARERSLGERLIFTGTIDSFFDYRFGKLPYRSINFVHEHLPGVDRFQATGTVNYPNDHDYTRITEFKYLTGQSGRGTSIVREFPTADGDPYYPIPRRENAKLYEQYRALTADLGDVTFLGRLAEYRYYNMDQVAGAALNVTDKLLGK